MAKNKIKNFSVIQRWMDSKTGQMFLNYAYSWGASIVILGALFKLTHISGADIMLFIGMGTEVIVFFLAGFERPWDKEEENDTQNAEASAQAAPSVIVGGAVGAAGIPMEGAGNVTGSTGGTIIIGGVPSGQPVYMGSQPQGIQQPTEDAQSVDPAQLAGNIASSPILCNPQYAGMTPDMAEATQAYVEQLKSLTETLQQVAEQSARLTRDSEEMENMNRTLTGINKFYEIQLRSVSAQSNTIDDVNAQTVKLAAQLEELNAVYARMVEALKVNMK
ncbi:MAG: gliding motility protein GldL [Bacteroides sp.]|nr:gliding motility protein GldL [Roseburia sp.]MCM1347039.1 gliding motility protein GldL [Bacteroides sp.]MCM1420728.1 gliding motility protein GldL [Bacteroides sp.]